ncbi:MAG: thermonuclease family protein [Fibromonadales bacterium]|nr:thermonuclease family protein [Fibromonadales bacterium]
MNKMKMLLFILLAISLCFADGAWVKGIAQDVHDGDTFKLKVAGQIIKIRMYGVDAPEKNQTYGEEAGKALRNLIEGKEVRLQITDKDRYGRTVGEPWLGDSLNVSLWMIKNGHAWWYKSYSKKRIDFKEAEEEAKVKKLGLWADDKPTAPWEFRKKKNGKKKSKKN